MSPFRKILVPLDFSSQSEAALRTAADLAQRYSASLTIVTSPSTRTWASSGCQ